MASEPRLLGRAKALYPYTSNDGSSLSFKQGDMIDVLAQLPSGWWDGFCNVDTGATTTTSLTSEGEDQLRPSSQQSRTTQLFDDYIEQTTANSSLPSSSWTVERPKDGASAYYYNQRTGEMLAVNPEIPYYSRRKTMTTKKTLPLIWKQVIFYPQMIHHQIL
ncbi:unnamed protein product [Absidia cylindrospora]